MQLLFALFALFVGFGWYSFFAGNVSGGLWLLALGIGSGVAIWRLRRYFVATQAAHNVVAAAATFAGLPPDRQQSVIDKSTEVMKRVGWMRDRLPSFQDDAERYGVYALAMAELEISPVCLVKRWNRVRNPFREALNPPYYMATSLHMAARKGFNVTLKRPSHRS